MLRKALKILGGLVALLLVAGTVFVASRQNLKFDETPYPDVVASKDSAVIDRGRYIVRAAAPCAACHGDLEQREANLRGDEVDLRGGFVWDIPPGKIYARNITSDKTTGLGNISDKALARALRYGVGHDGRALLPFMEMQGLSDDDLVAVISYLRTMAPVNNPVPDHSFNVLGKIVKATAMANPIGPSATPPAHAPKGVSVETGKYLVESVSVCWSCHTERNPMTGAMVGPRFGGTTGFTEVDDPDRSWSPPNITSDVETGRLGKISEQQFVERFRMGRTIPGSPMPWEKFSKLTEDDLRSIYQYLKSVPAVKNDVGPAVVSVKKS
jgi:mono/diheme cytochrome c family protein